jgi:hypothetical protein
MLNNNQLVLHLVADDTGKPVAGAGLEFLVRQGVRGERVLPAPMTADDQGVCVIPLARGGVSNLTISTRTDGFVDTGYSWSPARGESIPRQYTARLAHSVPIGGRVVDDVGKPVAGAEVHVWKIVADQRQLSDPPQIFDIAQEITAADAEGRWRMDRFANEAISRLRVWATHPYYFTEPFVVINMSNQGNPEAKKQLVAGTNTLKLTRGITVQGVVLDTNGHPVAGTKVSAVAEIERAPLTPSFVPGQSQSFTISRVDRIETTNQADGTFVLTGCRPGTNEFRGEARGFALASLRANLTKNPTSLRFVLNPGHVLRLRVVDADGLPVTNGGVSPTSSDPSSSLHTGFGARGGRGSDLNSGFGTRGGRGSDLISFVLQPSYPFRLGTEGRVVWESAPDSELQLEIRANGFEPTNMVVAADGEEHVVRLTSARTAPSLKVSGNVSDAATGQPINRFRVHTGRFETNPSFAPGWMRIESFQGGTFLHRELWGTNPRYALRFKFEADGYAPFVSRDVQPDEGNVQLDIALLPAVSTSVTVLLRDGQPAVNADIGFEMPGVPLEPVLNGLKHTVQGNYTNVFSTDENGRFALPPDDEVTRVIAACADGYAEATPAALTAAPVMRLQPWGRIEGAYLSGGKPTPGRALALGRSVGNRTYIGPITAETDADGHFVFPKVPPGEFTLWWDETHNQFYAPPVQVRLGETAVVSAAFYTVMARVSLASGVEMPANGSVRLFAYQPHPAKDHAASASLNQTSEGSWVANDLPAGDYNLKASIVEPPAIGSPPGTATTIREVRANLTFTIPADPLSGVLDLGEIVLQPVQ